MTLESNELTDRRSAPALIARVLLSAIFLHGGIHKLVDWGGSSQFMAANGMTAIPVFLALAAITELVAGAALLVGFKTRLAAAALFLYLIPVTLVFHDFWTLTGGNRQMQMISFLKNLAVMGGLAEVFAFGPGRISLDARLPRRGRLGGILEDRHAV